MFEQDKLQSRINQLYERIEAQLRQVLKEKRIRDGSGFTYDESLLASQLLAFAKACCPVLYAQNLYRPTQEFEARWPPILHNFSNTVFG